MANLIGQRLGQYEITALLGKGGMATVYRARQLNIKREVAIKVIKPDLAETSDFVRRFAREAETIAALEHPHIIKLFDYGQHEDVVYLVMQLLKGGSLADLIHRGPLAPDLASQIVDQIASALDYAHELGIVHRDLKPQNVLLDERRNVHLTDFGIAKILGETTALTQSGVAMGTPAYMSPEQWQGQPLDARADIYALGIMLFEVLAGRLPFMADTPYSMMNMHVNVSAPPIRDLRADLPRGVDGVIQKALVKRREERFSSAKELATAFKAALAGQIPVSPSLVLTNAAPLPPNEVTAANNRATPPGSASTPAMPATQSTSRRSRAPVLAIGIVIALVMVGGAVLLLSSGPKSTLTATPGPASPFATLTATPPPVTPTAVAQQPTSQPSEGPTLDIVYLAQTVDARDTAAAHLTSVALAQTQAVGLTATATFWTAAPTATITPTPNITASLNAFRTSRAATATATLWTPTPTPVPTVLANNQWKPVVQEFDGVEMMLVPAGCFLMGSSDGADDEKPVAKQCFDAPFWIDKTEVTQGQFKRLDGVAGTAPVFDGDNRPVERITWFEAQDFCAKRGARLPTEREWEYAARGPDNLAYPWGNSFDGKRVIYNRSLSDGTADVGSVPGGASWVGALDMSGNVWEWVSSVYKPYPYSPDDGRESIDDTTSLRVLRGGSWSSNGPALFRTANRGRDVPSHFNISAGFRCARSSEQASAATATPKFAPQSQTFNGVQMMLVPAGCFLMGSADGRNDEQPVSKQCFATPFLIDKTEVTQGQFARFGGATANAPHFKGDSLPVEQITWFEARDFCTKRRARLPTEAEWEYAARGPGDEVYPWGSLFDANKVVYHRSATIGTAEVGSIPGGASWVGALDMSGNVWE